MQPIENLIPIEKPERFRDLGAVDIDRLVAMVGKVSEAVWARENAEKENNFACFHHTDHLVFRFIHRNADHRSSYARQLWPAWQGLIQPVLDSVIKPYGFEKPEFPKVMLARLQGGYGIDPHTDGAGSNLHCHKIHVPLQTNAGATFHVDGVDRHLEKGQAYEVNNIKSHGVWNAGDEARIHLIFEVFEGAHERVKEGV
ncbi:hypothetical protein GCM10007939_20980 [Amylibacter marinus]|uniref:Aspartyl/asparaginy/proline hydroxylase domain-containing protein n=1 Tax=Amylibacter marinus TaxID=1475483 RepID=A0ABQ5VX32_9RHOB|nr:aspartyl/asparaginyl beta-hydroxylase domain-containing protein [Amylibacter marinus]GLQ35815.1 hypothetical protein GCM10007939_20980 [Amylibacter marinus]